ncbi:hypothetical protein [Flavobacterium sp.]|uniref:hypothetical protein n=1 Tax=Flavobacterium sp. TaxID=239 RepID=UPI00261FC282|nr:hypothetical protein [Flavobacterium sp.]
MSIVKRKTLKNASNVIKDDSGVTVKTAMKLIADSQYHEEVMEIFKIKDYENDFIEIKGADTLVKLLIEADKECVKFDIDSELSNVNISKFTSENELILEIANITDIETLETTRTDMLLAESTYSVKSEYLNDMYQIEKYMDFCLKHSYTDIIDKNLEMLQVKNKENKKSKKFRILKREDGKFFVRAITSVETYKDYNLCFSLFITLIELHKLIKHKSHSYKLESFSITESDLKVVFKSNKTHTISKDVQIGFALELINDEIRRDAVKINGIFSVIFDKTEIYVKPDETKANIISVNHGVGIPKLKERLGNLSEQINSFIEDTLDDAKQIKIINNPDLFREHLVFKLQYSRNVEFNKLYKAQIQKLLSNKVKTIFELSDIFNKVDVLIKDEHIDSLDFWRFKLYQVLLDGVKS